ncbi:MAG: hypothetical protein FWC16_12690 [Defluviitaleaceae bacterium]|nr:hypothetical protein [Defluviitaleaceae bacterium]MCL2274660.1 hypothetical protein [Defluviitaleaceae bacterium]MCL2275779.1 hypothetical protein [Defluviitaleaceae bacterium]
MVTHLLIMQIFSPFTWGLIVLLLWTIIYVAVRSSQARKKHDAMIQRFLVDEEAANTVKKRPLEDELFFTADLSVLPAVPEGDPHKVLRAASRKMIRFLNPISNVELKNRYGRLQLEYLAHYEENFNEYLRALTKWAESLSARGNEKDALMVLEHTLTLGSEFRGTYKLAADIYAQNKDEQKLDDLLAQAAIHTFRDPATGNHIIEYVREKLNELEN